MRRTILARTCAAALATAFALLSCGSAQAQGSANGRPAFDVASVKQVPLGDKSDVYQYKFQPGGRLLIRHFRVKDLILVAWHLRDFEIEGGPAWIDEQKLYYDIDAEAAGNPTDDQMRLMLRSLLENRFHLIAHMESQVKPHFVLRRSGELGSGLAPTKPGSCAPLADYGAQAPLPIAPAGAPPFCGFKARLVKLEGGGTAERFEWHGMPVANVARVLGTELGRQVNDETGLSGSYDVALEFRPDNFAGGPAAPGAAESTAPSIFSAVQQQLGLKLVAMRGPVQVLVIDRAEQPTAN